MMTLLYGRLVLVCASLSNRVILWRMDRRPGFKKPRDFSVRLYSPLIGRQRISTASSDVTLLENRCVTVLLMVDTLYVPLAEISGDLIDDNNNHVIIAQRTSPSCTSQHYAYTHHLASAIAQHRQYGQDRSSHELWSGRGRSVTLINLS